MDADAWNVTSVWPHEKASVSVATAVVLWMWVSELHDGAWSMTSFWTLISVSVATAIVLWTWVSELSGDAWTEVGAKPSTYNDHPSVW